MTAATIPSLKSKFSSEIIFEMLSFAAGITLLFLCAQVVIPLPWTPVPITGQTFGVALMSLLWGQKRAGLQMGGYLTLGFMGLPMFASLSGGLSFGPTFGYLIGMLVASQVMGRLADRGWAQSFPRSIFALMAGSFVTLSMGWLWLAQLMGYKAALFAGVLPFIPGDMVKTLLAASLLATFARKE